ncbi:hypothetical protein CEXT_281191 [Caerostris extrusa]|uniref:Uncharacterized protein n=1 Tax=Caerostris extrusa TaxID=172846 RepID=A0AAV4Y332_CAEEX|nr:hypothetical protein CEXT_281191 [Caerostris extrusa]
MQLDLMKSRCLGLYCRKLHLSAAHLYPSRGNAHLLIYWLLIINDLPGSPHFVLSILRACGGLDETPMSGTVLQEASSVSSSPLSISGNAHILIEWLLVIDGLPGRGIDNQSGPVNRQSRFCVEV